MEMAQCAENLPSKYQNLTYLCAHVNLDTVAHIFNFSTSTVGMEVETGEFL